MSKRSWYFRRGQFIPATDESAVKRRRLDAVAEVLAASGNPEAAGAIEAVGNLFNGPTVNPAALGRRRTAISRALRSTSSKRSNMGKTFTSMRRRRFRGRGRRRFRRRSFRNRVRSVLLSMTESRMATDNHGEATYRMGDGTTKSLFLVNPLAQLTVGDNDLNLSGNTVWLKGFKLRGRVRNNVTTSGVRVSFWMIRTRQFADLGTTPPTEYASTTTFNTNPTQAGGNENNIRQFDIISGTEPQVFVGDSSGVSKFDRDYVDILAKKDLYFRASTGDSALAWREFGLWVPIHRMWTFDIDQDTTPADQLRSIKNYNYYFCWQVYGSDSATNILAANTVTAHLDTTVYFKDV